jgi:hypothetical protein
MALSCLVGSGHKACAFSLASSINKCKIPYSDGAILSSRLFNTNTPPGSGNENENEKDEPDLFEYFDPLVSPHAYPNGISPDAKPEIPPPPKKASYANPFGIDYLSQKGEVEVESESESTRKDSSKGDGEDLLDYFDPLLSPHAYPNGVSPATKPPPLEEDDRYNPLKMNSDIMTGVASPSSGKKIGVLLMDHGSRNPASNNRLHRLAELYQLSIGDDGAGGASSTTGSQIIVTAAHMEIVTPSISDGLKTLLEQGVDEIVCHPYFLSPGRHVTEDIPEIVSQAIADLSIQIPVITTDPVGSNTQLMIGAIHSLVRENSKVLQEQKKA